jgi:hypothetical protein
MPFQVANHLDQDTLAAALIGMRGASAPGAVLGLDAYVWVDAIALLGGVDGRERVEVDVDARSVTTTREWDDVTTRVCHLLHTEQTLRDALSRAGWSVVQWEGGGADPKVWVVAAAV